VNKRKERSLALLLKLKFPAAQGLLFSIMFMDIVYVCFYIYVYTVSIYMYIHCV